MFCNDFYAVSELEVVTAETGHARFDFPDPIDNAALDFPPALVGECAQTRYVQIAAGVDYPLAEQVAVLE